MQSAEHATQDHSDQVSSSDEIDADSVISQCEQVVDIPLTGGNLALHVSFSFLQQGPGHRQQDGEYRRWQKWRRLTSGAYAYGDEDDDDNDDYLPDHYLLNMPTEGAGYYHAINGTNFHGTLSDFGINTTDYDDFTTHLNPASDVDVAGVIAATAFNSIVFAVLMVSYEILRRLVPSVYASKRQQAIMRGETPTTGDDYYMPFDWLMPVFGVPWSKVRKAGGLDAYMFLRYLRMCLRITSVSAFWGIVILWPIYGNADGPYSDAFSWYHFSMANIDQGSWRIWVPTIFIYLFSFFSFFCIKQELKHYVELRMEFLGKGPSGVNSLQQTYSIIIERIPADLRSDRALFDYFNRLFPNKVHSACVILNVPDLEVTAKRVERVTRRLEKSIAYYEATRRRPTHIAGRPRVNFLNIECSPLELDIGRHCHETYDFEEEGAMPPKGAVVDSIDYYTFDLAEINHHLFFGQRKKAQIAHTGNMSIRADGWISKATAYASSIGASVIGESHEANSLVKTPRPFKAVSENDMDSAAGVGKPDSNNRKSFNDYGSINDENENNDSDGSLDIPRAWSSDEEESLGGVNFNEDRDLWEVEDEVVEAKEEDATNGTTDSNVERSKSAAKKEIACHSIPDDCTCALRAPTKSTFIRLAARLGMDFFVAALHFLHKRVQMLFDGTSSGTTSLSATGFVTFYTHEAATIAACAQLTHKPNALEVLVAPEPRDIIWNNSNIHKDIRRGKEISANIFLGVGIIFWSIPLAAIQAFAKAEQIAMIPGFEWVLKLNGGNLQAFINGYLPVVALLTLICALPLIFEAIATGYEKRKTRSDVQDSIVGRYFYYQIANIYVTVTAGSIWKAAADIIERPAEMLEILGESIPMMVGYFMSLLITKILAGLPMVILRSGALSRMFLLRSCFSRAKLTQRELDEVYRKQTVYYGWEYPTQLLVIMVAFAYACISPVILPVAAAYFLGALIVYKKQILYVYAPTYESGGRLFPVVCDRTLFGLIISQLTFIGYSLIRKGKWQPLFLAPLPFITLYMMYYFRAHYANPSLKLSLERAIELDHRADIKASGGNDDETYTPRAAAMKLKEKFSEDFYRQPVLTAEAGRPLPYRRKEGPDQLTKIAWSKLDGETSRYQRMLDGNKTGAISGLRAAKEQNSAQRRLDIHRSLFDHYSLNEILTSTESGDGGNSDDKSGKQVSFGPREIV